MGIHIQVVIVVIAALLIAVFFSFKYLSRKMRISMYVVTLVLVVGIIGYIRINTNPSSDYIFKFIVSGFTVPVQAIWDADNPNRFFVVQRGGVISVVINGEIKEKPFLDITDKVISDNPEQGLLSMVLHPEFSRNGVFYVYYTDLGGNVVVERYTTHPADRTVADVGSEISIIKVNKKNIFHNGGALSFGPDQYLYIGIGDDNPNDFSFSAQQLDSFLGKILRLDVSDLGVPYKIPQTNPWVNVPNVAPEIWAYGLRNPWRIAFSSQTGDLYISDVGQMRREEINYQPVNSPGGENYGWPWFEGNKLSDVDDAESVNSQDFVSPVFDYDHSSLGGCAIIGGVVYSGEELPELKGKYLFSDYCFGFLRSLEIRKNGKAQIKNLIGSSDLQPSGFAVDNDGEVYLLDVTSGGIYKLVRK